MHSQHVHGNGGGGVCSGHRPIRHRLQGHGHCKVCDWSVLAWWWVEHCLLKYNTIKYNTNKNIQYKQEYYYSGTNPVEFRGYIITCVVFRVFKFF